MTHRTDSRKQATPVALHREHDAGRIARLAAGVAIYTAAALMLLR
jgi:hypothetical protein